MANDEHVMEGGCVCSAVRYRMDGPPLIVHCCHCSWCQRETGSAFALNALVEADRVHLLSGDIEEILTPSASGAGQRICRCSRCKVAVWSRYAMPDIGDRVNFIRVGTLDRPGLLPPDVHIFTASALPWVSLDGDAPVFSDYYRASELWSQSSLRRRRMLQEAGGASR